MNNNAIRTFLIIIQGLLYLLILLNLYKLYIYIKRIFHSLIKLNEILQNTFLKFKNKKLNKFNKIRLKNFKKNFIKLKKYINFKLIFYIIISLLFTDSLCLSQEDNNIHHYLVKDDGDLVEVTNEDEKERLGKENELDEEKIKQEKKDFKILIIILVLLFGLFWFYYFDSFNSDNSDPSDPSDPSGSIFSASNPLDSKPIKYNPADYNPADYEYNPADFESPDSIFSDYESSESSESSDFEKDEKEKKKPYVRTSYVHNIDNPPFSEFPEVDADYEKFLKSDEELIEIKKQLKEADSEVLKIWRKEESAEIIKKVSQKERNEIFLKLQKEAHPFLTINVKEDTIKAHEELDDVVNNLLKNEEHQNINERLKLLKKRIVDNTKIVKECSDKSEKLYDTKIKPLEYIIKAAKHAKEVIKDIQYQKEIEEKLKKLKEEYLKETS